MAAHALLSASGAKRWLACTPSPRLEENFENRSSDFANEGTFAHAYSEALLRIWIGGNDGADIAEAESMRDSEWYSDELERKVSEHCNYVMERFAAAGKHADILLESKLRFDNWVPDGFGTGDVVIVSNEFDYFEILDLKYGKGIPVFAENNPQLRLYALGCLQEFGLLYDFKKVITTISQPRLDSYTSEELTVDELLHWGEYVKSRAEIAFRGEGEFCAGEHCQFCRAGGACRHRMQQSAMDDFYEPETALLTHEELAGIITRAKVYAPWLKQVEKHALSEAMSGNEIPGYKIVRANTKKKFDDEAKVLAELEASGRIHSDLVKEQLKSATELKVVLGKEDFERLVVPHQVKPEGGPVLAPISDKRPVFNPAAEDFKESIDNDLLD